MLYECESVQWMLCGSFSEIFRVDEKCDFNFYYRWRLIDDCVVYKKRSIERFFGYQFLSIFNDYFHKLRFFEFNYIVMNFRRKIKFIDFFTFAVTYKFFNIVML